MITVKEIVCWYVTTCNLVAVLQHSEGHAVFVFGVENGESRFLRNVEKCLSDYTASYYVHLSLLMNGLLIVSEKLVYLVIICILNSLEHGSPTRGLSGCIVRPVGTFVN
jgi:hypothetical protein